MNLWFFDPFVGFAAVVIYNIFIYLLGYYVTVLCNYYFN